MSVVFHSVDLATFNWKQYLSDTWVVSENLGEDFIRCQLFPLSISAFTASFIINYFLALFVLKWFCCLVSDVPKH